METQHIEAVAKMETELRLQLEKRIVDRGSPPIEQTTKARALAFARETSDIKNPDGDLLSPASMPADQQGETPPKLLHHDLEGQQAGTNGGGHEAS